MCDRLVRGGQMMPLHFSTLKAFAKSPAHYRHEARREREETAAMRIGTYVHQLVLGSRFGEECRVYDGVRRGKEWETFKATGGTILNLTEAAEAKAIAASVMSDPIAGSLLRCARSELPLRWQFDEFECETRGIDIVGEGYIADLKTTQCADPKAFERQSFLAEYHTQLAFYETACSQHGIDTSKGLYLIGVESSPPYPVTVFRLSDALVSHGYKTLTQWFAKLRECLSAERWPGYAETIVNLDVPRWA